MLTGSRGCVLLFGILLLHACTGLTETVMESNATQVHRYLSVPPSQSIAVLVDPFVTSLDRYICSGDVRLCNSGFTVSLKLLLAPPLSDSPLTEPTRYVISTGGQSPSSNGYYIRQNYGREYEVGVAVDNTLWKYSVLLAGTGTCDLLFTWSLQNGIRLYTDGIRSVDSAASQSDRVYTKPKYDPYPHLAVGVANDMTHATVARDLTCWNVTTTSYELQQQHVTESLDTTDYFLGCEPKPASGSGPTEDSVLLCRTKCASTEEKAYSLYSATSKRCYCSDVHGAVTQCGQNDYSVYRATHEHFPQPEPMGLTITPVRAENASRTYTRPNETLTFDLRVTNYKEAVAYLIDFGDGTESILTDSSSVSHAYAVEGHYVITVISEGRLQVQQQEQLNVSILYIDERKRPELVVVVGSRVPTSPLNCRLYLSAVDAESCDVSPGDGSATYSFLIPPAAGTAYLTEREVEHPYRRPGLYTANATCRNAAGERESASYALIAVEPTLQYAVIKDTDDVLLEVTVPVAGSVSVSVDDRAVPFAVRGGATVVILAEDVAVATERASGEHIVKVTTSDIGETTTLLRRVVNVQRAFDGLAASANPRHTRANETVTLSFTVHETAATHLQLDFDGGLGGSYSEYLYVEHAESPLHIERTYSYDTLGTHYVTLRVANRLNSGIIRAEVSVERPIAAATMTGGSVKYLGDQSVFEFGVDVGVWPLQPFDIDIDYHNGRETVAHLGRSAIRSHSYVYPDYGRYVVMATVSNNISSVEVENSIQIGEDILELDIAVNNDGRVAVQHNLTFTISCPYGSPITLSVAFGDGSREELRRPSRRRVSSTTGAATTDAPVSSVAPLEFTSDALRYTDADLHTADDFEVTAEGQVRVRRQAGGGGGVTIADIVRLQTEAVDDIELNHADNATLAPSVTLGGDTGDSSEFDRSITFTVSHFYKKPGSFRVKVVASNLFTTRTTHLCPDIVVVSSKQHTEVVCSQFSFEQTNLDNSIQTPVEVMRSASLTVGTQSTLKCQGAGHTAKYAWSAKRLMSGGATSPADDLVWRPELGICASDSKLSEFTIFSHTLWYGVYRLTSTMTVYLGSQPTLKYIDLDRPLYVKVVATPLIAVIRDQTSFKKDLTKYQMISIDADPSRDPDVSSDNSTGMTYHIVAYSESLRYRLQNASLAEILEGATELANSTAGDTFFYEYDSCFESYGNIQIMGHEVVYKADLMTKNGTIFLQLYVTKDDREASTSQEIKVWPTNATGNSVDVLSALLASGDNSAALLVLDDIASSLNMDTSSSDDAEAKAKRSEMRTTLIKFIGKVSENVKNADQLGKTASVLNSITSVKAEVTTESKSNAAGALSNIGGKSKTLAVKSSMSEVQDMGGSMFKCACNVVTFKKDKEVIPVEPDTDMELKAAQLKFAIAKGLVVEEIIEEPEPLCCDNYGGLCAWISGDFECPYRDIFNLDDIDGKWEVWNEIECSEQQPDDMAILVDWFSCYNETLKLALYAQEKDVTGKAFSATLNIGSVAMSKLDGESSTAPVSIVSPDIKMVMASFETETMSRRRKRNARKKRGAHHANAEEQNGVPAVIIPESVMRMAGHGGGVSLCTSGNLFGFSDSAADVKGDVQTLNVAGSDGEWITIAESDPITLWMNNNANVAPLAKNYSSVSVPGEAIDMNFHTLNVTTNSSGIHVMIVPQNPDDKFDIYVERSYNFSQPLFPNETHFLWKAVVPDFFALDFSELPADLSASDREFRINSLKFTAFIPQNLTVLGGLYVIGIKLNEDSKMKVGERDLNKNFTYEFKVFISGCRYWNEINDTWSTHGCNIGPLTTTVSTQCLCDHLTSFGGDFVVPPNTIDFSTVFTLEKFLESMPVFITVLLVLMIYVGMMVWGRREDKKDLVKWGATPLEDNLPTDTYHYQMTVYTGTKKTACTTSKISFILSGDDGDTGARRLYDGKRKVIPSGSIYNYLVSTEQCLGPLTYLRIWHDNNGHGKMRSWQLGQIQLTDLQTGERFFFLCDRWLAVEEDDGQVERILPVAGLQDLTAFKHLFNTSVRKKLSNDHMWFSVVSRPTKSNFTRVQRVSCCASLLFLTMITNCMFFRTEDNVKSVSAIQLGPVSFTLSQLFISIVTTVIVFPPSIIIVTIFRRARGKKNTIMQSNQKLSQKSKKYKWRAVSSSIWQNVERSRGQKFKDALTNILTLHQRTKYETDKPEDAGPKKKKKTSSLPHFFVYVAWSLVFFTVIGPAFFTVLYSMEWGRKKSVEWLTTFVMSFFQSVIVVQPIKVLLLAAFISCVMRKPDIDDDEETFEDANVNAHLANAQTNTSDRDIAEIIEQRKMAASHVAPPDLESLEKTRILRMNEMQMEAILKECLVYFIFLMVIFFLSYQARDSSSFNYSENIKNTFERNTPAYHNIKTPNVFWSWIHTTLLPNLYSGPWYNGERLDWREGLQMDDRQTIRVGVGRFRQLRVKDDTCNVQPAFESLIHHCRNSYGWLDDDTKDYHPGWRKEGDLNHWWAVKERNARNASGLPPLARDRGASDEVKHDRKSSWVYRDSVETKTAPYSGAIASYKGGGYTFVFRRSRRTTERMIRDLEKREWVDMNTRAIFIEFTLYNANANLFASVIMVIEFMSTGAANTRCEVKIFRMSSYVGGFGIIVLFIEMVYLVFTLYFFARMVRLLKKERMKYFKDFWNMLEFATLVMGIVAIAMYAMKKIFGAFAMTLLAESGSGDYVNFVTISIWDEMFGLVLAGVVFVSTIKFIKMLKFNKRMSLMGDTIRLATKDLKMFSISFFIYYIAFCMFGYLLFGKQLPGYGTFAGAFESLFAFALGDFDFGAFEDAHRIMGPVFFFMYVAIVYIGLMGMFLTIIYDAFAQVKSNADMRSNDYEIVDFIIGKLRGVFGWK